jgi:hypothetical protein
MSMDWPPSLKSEQPEENGLSGILSVAFPPRCRAPSAISGIALTKTGHNIAHTVRALPRHCCKSRY